MRRIATIILTIVVILGIGGGAYAYVASQREWWPFDNSVIQATTSDFTQLIAKDLAAYAYLDLSNPNIAAQISSSPELMQNVTTLKNSIQRLSSWIISSPAAGTDMQQQNDLMQGVSYLSSKKVHLAWDTTSTSMNATSAPLSGTVIVGIETMSADDSNQIMATLKRFFSTNKNTVISENTLANHPVTQVSTAGGNTPEDASNIYLTNLGNKLIIITSSAEAMGQVITRTTTPTDDVFAKNQHFLALASKLNGPQLATIYLDNIKYFTALESNSTPNNSPSDLQLQQSMLSNPLYQSNSLTGLTFNQKGLYSESYTSFADGQVANLFNNSTTSFTNRVPNDTLFFQEGHNLAQLFSGYISPLLEAVDATTEADGATTPSEAFTQLAELLNISIPNDIAPLFRQTSAIAIHGADSSMAPIAVSILTEITNNAAAEQTMAKIANAIIAQASSESGLIMPAPTSSEENGITIHSAAELDGSETVFNYATTQDGRILLASSALNGIKSILDIMQTPAASLAQSPKYPDLLKNVPANNMISYIDLRAIADAILPFASFMLDSESADMFATEIKPAIDTLNNLASYSTVDGNMIKSIAQLQLVK